MKVTERATRIDASIMLGGTANAAAKLVELSLQIKAFSMIILLFLICFVATAGLSDRHTSGWLESYSKLFISLLAPFSQQELLQMLALVLNLISLFTFADWFGNFHSHAARFCLHPSIPPTLFQVNWTYKF